MSSPWGMTVAELRDWVRTDLGQADLEVELSDGDIDKCAGDSCRVFNRWHPPYGCGTLSSVSPTNLQVASGGRGQITRFWVDHKGIQDVFDVHFLRKLQYTDFIGIENPFYLDAVMRTFQGGTAGEYLADLSYLEQAKKIFSSHPEWRAEWVYDATEKRRRLSLFIDISSIGVSFEFYDICYFFFYHYEPSDSPENGLRTIPKEYEQWFRDYAVARAKQILGRKLGKYGGIPNPFGGQIQTDGERLRLEGREDQFRLDKEARGFKRPVPILTE